MLIVSRKIGEVVLIRVPGVQEPIRVKVVKLGRSKARLGFEASGDVEIIRAELEERVDGRESAI